MTKYELFTLSHKCIVYINNILCGEFLT